MTPKKSLLTSQNVKNRIFTIRGVQVILDSDLAEMYHVTTGRINEQVKRNPERFPNDFMFQLSDSEWQNLKSQNAIASWGGRRTRPFVFTEQGVSSLSGISRVGIPSIRSKGNHDFHNVEQDANRRAFLYFNKNIEGFQDDSDQSDNRGWNFWSNPLNINGTNARLQYVDYRDPNQVNLLNVLEVRAKWYDHVSWLYFLAGGPIWVGLINSGIYNR